MSYPGPAGGDPGAGLVCGVCLFSREGTAEDAVTVINGVACCDDHLEIVASGGSFNSMIATAGGQHSPPRRPAEE